MGGSAERRRGPREVAREVVDEEGERANSGWDAGGVDEEGERERESEREGAETAVSVEGSRGKVAAAEVVEESSGSAGATGMGYFRGRPRPRFIGRPSSPSGGG